MSFRRHMNMIDSELPWLGEIPSHWEVTRLRRLVEIKKDIAGELGYDVFSVTQNGFRIKDTESGEGQQSLDYSKYQFVKVGQFAMNPMDLLTGGADIATTVGVTSPDYRVFEIRDSEVMYDQFLLYMLQMIYRNHIFYAYGQGSSQLGRWRLPRQQFNDFQIPVPPLDEQKAISSFLDVETSKIDGLVSEQRRLIELLKEKRQAVISHAVTKGLNPNAPMKHSGIQWLGDVPQHWELKKLRYFAEVLRGKFTHRPRNDPAFYDGDYPFVQTGEITGASKFITGYRQTLNERGISVSKQFPKGTLVMAIAANIGDVAILDFPAYFPDSIVGLVPNGTADVMFMYYLMQAMKQPMVQTATISTQMNLNVEQICSLTAACPPVDEQKAIAEFLDRQVEKFSQLQAEAERAIELLQERRTALISAAVTGQIDVREFAYQETA